MFNFLASPTVKIRLEEEQLFICPSLEGTSTSTPTRLRGTAHLAFPSARPLRACRIVLKGRYNAYGGGTHAYESGTTLEDTLEVEYDGEMLEAGEHAFAFSFEIPSSTPPSQRCVYGMIMHSVQAHFELGTSTVSSDRMGFWLSANPSLPSEGPLAMDVSTQHYSDDLGAVATLLTSPYLTVASLLTLRLTLVGPPKPVVIEAVDAVLTQTFEIVYKDGVVVKPRPQRFVLAKLDERVAEGAEGEKSKSTASSSSTPFPPSSSSISSSSSPALPTTSLPTSPSFNPTIVPDPHHLRDPLPLISLPPLLPFSHSRICRVPTEEQVRPTTLEGTEGGPIRVRHRLAVEVRYRVAGVGKGDEGEGEGEVKVLSLEKSVVVASCTCLLDSLYLPSYAPLAPPSVPPRPRRKRCACYLHVEGGVGEG